MEWAQWLEQVFRNKDYDLTIVSHTEPMDIGIYARDDYYFNYENPELSRRSWHSLAAEVADEERYAIMSCWPKRSACIAEDAVNGFIFPACQARGLGCQTCRGFGRTALCRPTI